MKYKLFFLLLFYNSFYINVYAQTEKEYLMDEVIVTASRIPISSNDLTRSVLILTEEEIKNLPAVSIQDLFQYLGSVDIRQRGLFGVQADVSIRGGTFEQTLILLDGMKVNDPQTGHHNLNLPVSLENIERIEVLKGQGSRMFGPNAFSGVINIITKKDYQRSVSASISGGEFGYYGEDLNISLPVGSLSNNLSLSKSKSNGYVHNTNFDVLNFFYNSNLHSTINGSLWNFNLFLGYNDKEFGANGFYSDRFPNQWEHTTTKFAGGIAKTNWENFFLSSKIYLRRNDDNFLLDYTHPSFYENMHQTDVYTIELQADLQTNTGDFSIGGEFTEDQIESTNLGSHKRENKGAFAEYKFSPLQNLIFNAGVFLYNYAAIGWKFWPGLDAAYRIKSNIKIFGSVGKAFRIPTYTELYYSDPASQGSSNLRYEELINYEIGFGYLETSYSINLSLFRKDGKNLIDWVRFSPDEKWLARNIAEVNTNGAEVSFNFNPQFIIVSSPVYQVDFSYTYLGTDKEIGAGVSRYVLDHLRQQLIVNIGNYLPFGIFQNWIFRYEDRINLEDHFLADLHLRKEINNPSWKTGLEFSLRVLNLFNKTYKNIASVTLPGRWLIGGVKLKLSL